MEHLIQQAGDFINKTNRNIFLTGKAGTGKTTFLRNLAKTTHKKFAIVAPTGIAALNAKGVTIHSQFLLPLGTFIPVNEPSGNISENAQIFTQYTLTRKHPLNAARKQLLREIDLLIIDEVSMLRADVLDAIDHRLKTARRNYQRPFGGVQILLIGDLFQLPPIVRDHEWSIMRNYYQNAFFFESHALKQSGYVYLELEKIFRQDDATFISLLNNLRNNAPTASDIQLLNQHYQPNFNSNEIVTLTTHNNTADQINGDSLKSLDGKSFTYDAKIEGDFPESMYPVDSCIELKKGAQIMFIKNDAQDGIYYNGKLATVVSLDNERVKVRLADSSDEYVLRTETWENKKYTINPETKEIEEEVIGSFNHYPIKLAWAITVHKSQGLTFDKAIIDVGRAFAPGQVYVALSRLRSLDGLVLKTQISEHGVASDANVVSFSQQKEHQPPLEEMLSQGQKVYLHDLIQSTFDFQEIQQQIGYIKRGKASSKMEFEDETMRHALDNIAEKLHAEADNTRKFRHQLAYYLQENDQEKLGERIEAGSGYYKKLLRTCMVDLLKHIAATKQLTRTKTYLNELLEIDQLILGKLSSIYQVSYVTKQILKGEEIDTKNAGLLALKQDRESIITEINVNLKEAGSSKSGKRKKGTAPKKGETHEKSLALFKEGRSIENAAEIRGLTVGTMESHAALLIGEGKIDISAFMSKEEVDAISEIFKNKEIKTTTDAVKALDQNFSYGQVRMVQAFLKAAEG